MGRAGAEECGGFEGSSEWGRWFYGAWGRRFGVAVGPKGQVFCGGETGGPAARPLRGVAKQARRAGVEPAASRFGAGDSSTEELPARETPTDGFEPPTCRLTAGRSTVELREYEWVTVGFEPTTLGL